MKSNGGLVHFEWKAWVESVCNQNMPKHCWGGSE